jgi:hypothetical protein
VYIVFAGLLVLETVPSNSFCIQGMYNKKFNDVCVSSSKDQTRHPNVQHLLRFIIRQYHG